MIVFEQNGPYANVYVDGYVFSADSEKQRWGFGDGDDTPGRRQAEAAKRGMSEAEFADHYQHICNAAACWDDPVWTYRYNVVAMSGQVGFMLQEVMDRAEEAITRNKAEQDRERCQLMLKRYVSLGMIRQFGLAIRQYIYHRESGRARIVYQMAELAPFEVASLIPPKVLASAVHRAA